MEYRKPRIVSMEKAFSAIHGTKVSGPIEIPITDPTHTTNAYQADE
jgi:hypothetical protein